jgi:UDP-GlcNAc3NAcA epimerase
MKVVTVIGARPQFIKAAAVSKALKTHAPEIQEILVHTGQHFDQNMSNIFFDQMGIPTPSYRFDIHSLPHGAMTGLMLARIEEVLLTERPDAVVVFGDTNSTLAGALAARKQNIPVAHVEAGLRSFNLEMPEEINRILTDRISTLLFCPTQKAVDNLQLEAFDRYDCRIVVTGDVMLDAVLTFGPMATPPLISLPERFVLATIHRQSNTDNLEVLQQLIDALHIIGASVPVVLPIHPRTRNILSSSAIKLQDDRIILVDPVGYLESLWLIRNADLVLTDSGGLQKEAYFLGKGCVTLRDETEWTELVESGANIPAGTSVQGILEAFETLSAAVIVPDLSMYGSGAASETIAAILLHLHHEM